MENTNLPRSNQPEFTVTEISYALKKTVETAFGYVRVRGEISGLKKHSSGHFYYSLKDENSVINCVSWRGSQPTFKKELQDGVEVICSGKVTTFPGQSKYQIVVETVELAGLGALMALLEKRKTQLAKEGLFDESRKKPLPAFPETIGIVTSPTGAVIRDILHRISDRYPLKVLVWPVAVQGEGAAEQVAAAIDGFNNLPENIAQPDVLIVARGGGSIEDLWAFNEEIVVRAAANSKIPLISAVGHETDTTLIDFASDRRAPTPTAAAEIAVPVRMEIISSLLEATQRLLFLVNRIINDRQNHLKAAAAALISPKQMIENMMQKFDDWSERFSNSLNAMLKNKSDQLKIKSTGLKPFLVAKKFEAANNSLSSLGKLLESYHYEKILQRGFALVWDSSGKLVKTAAGANSGAEIKIQFHDGHKKAVIDGTGSKPKKLQKKSTTTQQDLF